MSVQITIPLWHSYLLFNWFHSNPLHFAFEYAMLSDKAINVSFIVCRTFQHWKKEAIASGHSVLHQQQSGCYHCCCYLCYCYRCSCCCFCFHYCFYLFSFVQGVGGDFARCSLGSLLNRRGWATVGAILHSNDTFSLSRCTNHSYQEKSNFACAILGNNVKWKR